MLVLTVEIDRPAADALAVKESLAMELERFGDVRVASVREENPKQMTLLTGDNRSEGPRPKPKLRAASQHRT